MFIIFFSIALKLDTADLAQNFNCLHTRALAYWERAAAGTTNGLAIRGLLKDLVKANHEAKNMYFVLFELCKQQSFLGCTSVPWGKEELITNGHVWSQMGLCTQEVAMAEAVATAVM